MRNLSICSIAALICLSSPLAALAQERLSTATKGSLLIYSKVELKWTLQSNGYILTQDSFLTLQNDFQDDVDVQLYFVNGDPRLSPVFAQDGSPIERGHPGWNYFNCLSRLTGNQPLYWSANTGLSLNCPPFTILDPGFPPGRPDPEVRNGRMLRGFVYAWAVKPRGMGPGSVTNAQIRWNHLSGDGQLVNYDLGTAARYNAYAAQVVDRRNGPAHGDFVGIAGNIRLDGFEYQAAFDRLLLNFYASRSLALSGGGTPVQLETDITLHPVPADFRQNGSGPVTTKAVFEVWNENEMRFSGMERCITCWDQTLASSYGPVNFFLFPNLQTHKGAARINGIPSTTCPTSVYSPLLGLSIEQLLFLPPAALAVIKARAASAMTLVGTGEEKTAIRYDLLEVRGDQLSGESEFGGGAQPPPQKGDRETLPIEE